MMEDQAICKEGLCCAARLYHGRSTPPSNSAGPSGLMRQPAQWTRLSSEQVTSCCGCCSCCARRPAPRRRGGRPEHARKRLMHANTCWVRAAACRSGGPGSGACPGHERSRGGGAGARVCIWHRHQLPAQRGWVPRALSLMPCTCRIRIRIRILHQALPVGGGIVSPSSRDPTRRGLTAQPPPQPAPNPGF